MKTRSKLIGFIAMAIIALAFFACGDKGDDPPPHEHEWEWVVTTAATDTADGVETEKCKTCGDTRGTRPLYKVRETTITAFSKSITVKSDGSVSYANFQTAKTKLQGAMTEAESWCSGNDKTKFSTMLNRTGFAIIVNTGDGIPSANAEKSMTIGIDYILANDAYAIATDIFTAVIDDKLFADTTAPKARMENQPAQTLTFTGSETYSVTVKSADLYTDADWAVDVAKVVTTLNASYSKGSMPDFNTVFAADQNAVVVLVKDLSNNYEVRDGEFRTLYLKTGSIETANYDDAITYMRYNYPEVGQAAPIKNKTEYLATTSNKNLNNPLV